MQGVGYQPILKMEPNCLPVTLADQQLETIIHRIRAYDYCERMPVLLKTFFDLSPLDQPLRICHAPEGKQPSTS